jgi:hypothetical protein
MHTWVRSSAATAAGLASGAVNWYTVDSCGSFRAESFRELFRMEKNCWKQLWQA